MWDFLLVLCKTLNFDFDVLRKHNQLRVEDYASDLNDIAFEEAHDQRSLFDQINNTLTNQPDAFTAVQTRTQACLLLNDYNCIIISINLLFMT